MSHWMVEIYLGVEDDQAKHDLEWVGIWAATTLISLWALAAGALPGAGGLVIATLAGVRVGYRQAKAGFALRTTGIAHFTRPGPLAIVRPMALRVVRPGALSAEHLLDKAA